MVIMAPLVIMVQMVIMVHLVIMVHRIIMVIPDRAPLHRARDRDQEPHRLHHDHQGQADQHQVHRPQHDARWEGDRHHHQAHPQVSQQSEITSVFGKNTDFQNLENMFSLEFYFPYQYLVVFGD